jgi:hypothetical protein
MTIVIMMAPSIVRRLAPRARPASICMTTGHTDPGTYLPSWLVKKTRPPAFQGMLTPRPSSTDRQTGNVAATPITPQTKLAAIGHPPICWRESTKLPRLR